MEEVGQDMISSLPNNLLHHILSFIGMKYAVQTSVLSKRWKNTWVSLPYLNFTYSNFTAGRDNDSVSRGYEHLDRFLDFVYMVFMLRDDSDIQMLEVDLDWTTSMSNDQYSRNLNRWIVTAVGRNVKELSLGIHEQPYELPPQLLNCKSLTKLGVYGGRRTKYTNIFLPKSMGLPQLKQLLFAGVTISNAELTQRLLTSCPLLEMLIMVNCDLRRNIQQNFSFDSLSLERFGYHGKYLRLENCSMASNIKLSAPNLINFNCMGFLRHEYSLENLPSVGTAWFKLILEEYVKDETAETYTKLPAEGKKVYAKRAMNFLEAVPNVVLSHAPDALDFQPLHFCKLHRLNLEIWFTRGCLRSTAYLLGISPNVKSIILTSKETCLADVGDEWEAGLTSPLLSHLESVVIKEVEGCDNELKFLSFLLKHAKVLKKLRLVTRSTVGSNDRARQVNRIGDALLALASANSHIVASYYLNDVLLAQGDDSAT